MSRWLEYTRAVFDAHAKGNRTCRHQHGRLHALLLLRALMAERPQDSARVKALVLIAPAWDMTKLMWENFSAQARRDITEKASTIARRPTATARIRSASLLDDGERHLIGDKPYDPARPCTSSTSLLDPDVPWEHNAATSSRTWPATGHGSRRYPMASNRLSGPKTSR